VAAQALEPSTFPTLAAQVCLRLLPVQVALCGGACGRTSGNTVGIHARTDDATGVAALLDGHATGNIILGRSHASGINTNEFRVDGTGKGFFNGGTQTGARTSPNPYQCAASA